MKRKDRNNKNRRKMYRENSDTAEGKDLSLPKENDIPNSELGNTKLNITNSEIKKTKQRDEGDARDGNLRRVNRINNGEEIVPNNAPHEINLPKQQLQRKNYRHRNNRPQSRGDHLVGNETVAGPSSDQSRYEVPCHQMNMPKQQHQRKHYRHKNNRRQSRGDHLVGNEIVAGPSSDESRYEVPCQNNEIVSHNASGRGRLSDFRKPTEIKSLSSSDRANHVTENNNQRNVPVHYVHYVSFVEDDYRMVKIRTQRQIEYYFSEENLVKDFFLRSQMDIWGFTPVILIASFPRIRRLTSDLTLILEAIQESDNLQVTKFEDGYKIRTTYQPRKWPISQSERNFLL